MRKTPEITSVAFKPPRDARLIVEVMSIEELRNRAPAEHFEKLQRADFYRLIGVLDGDTRPMVDFSTFEVQARDWLLVRPGQVFRYDFSVPWAGWLLVFRPEGLASPGRSRSRNDFDLVRRVEDLACLRSLNQEQHDWMNHSMHQLQLDGSLMADVALRNELLRLAIATVLLRLSMWQSLNTPANAQMTTEQAHFRRFRKLLDVDFATQHQVQYYAGVLGMSEKTLSRVCSAATGLSAKAVINQRLELEAKRLLAHTTMSVQTIGREMGFEEATNFVKFFRKKSEMTPLAFRQMNSQATN